MSDEDENDDADEGSEAGKASLDSSDQVLGMPSQVSRKGAVFHANPPSVVKCFMKAKSASQLQRSASKRFMASAKQSAGGSMGDDGSAGGTDNLAHLDGQPDGKVAITWIEKLR